jgi:60S ribosomal protein uL30
MSSAKPAAAAAKPAAKPVAKDAKPVAEGLKRKRAEKPVSKKTKEQKLAIRKKWDDKRKAFLTKKKKNFIAKPRKISIKRSKEVPEEIRKKLARSKLRKEKKDEIKVKQAKKNAWRRKEYFVRAEKYVKSYRTEAKQVVQAKRDAKAKGDLFVEAQPRLAVVTRIKGILGVSPKPRKVLQLLRLRQINNTVFVRLNKSTLSLLKLVEPYVAWGYPTLATVRKLIYKRGFLKIDGKRVPLVDNKQIERALGTKDIICVEDLIHEIYTTGSKFALCNGLLWPFKLNNPRGGFRDKGTHFIEGGDAGNREVFINELLNRMI